MKKDYYEILGVPKDSTIQQIKKKYRSLALKYHPDRVEESEKLKSEEKFKEISEAYGVLSDAKKRQMYDQYGHAGIDQNYTSEDIFGGADFSSIFEGGGMGDIFSQFFGGGGGGGQRRPQRGRDIQYELEITLEDAYKGIAKKIKVPRYEHCESCKGTGAKDGTQLKTCDSCGGQGQVMMSSGFFRIQQPCPHCQGQGKTILEHCPKCHGKGKVKVTRSIDVNIPAGVDNSSRLRVRNEGEIGKGGPGDLYLYIHVVNHDTFKRDGNDIYMELPVSFVTAALGGEVSVPSLAGSVTMKIPVGIQSGKVLRLKEKGMPDLRSGYHGNQYVKIMIQVPTKLSGEQRRLLEAFADLSGDTDISKKDAKSLKEKIKKFFK